MVAPAAEELTPGGVRELALVTAVAVALTVILTFPLSLNLAGIGRADSDDGKFSIWNVSWVARTLVVDPLHVFDANIFYPHTGPLAYSEANLGAGVLAIPGYWATRDPYFAHNSAVLIAFVLCWIGTYHLGRYLTGDRRAAAIAAICYTFCPYVFAHTPHIQLMMTLGLPYSMLAFHRLADRPTRGRGFALGAAMAGTTYFCAYYGVFVVLMIGLAVLFTAAARRLWRDERYWYAIGAGAASAVLLILPLFQPYMQLQGQGFSRSVDESRQYSSDWRAYITSSARAHTWMWQRWGKGSETAFPGFVALVFAAAGLVVKRWTSSRAREAIALYAAFAALAIWASLGPAAWLYTVLYWLVPGFTMMRAPARFAPVVALAVSMLAAFGVKALLDRAKWAAGVAALVALVAAAELVEVVRYSQVPLFPAVYEKLARLPPAPVIEMPFFWREVGFFRHAVWMLYSTSHWKPMVNGYSDYLPPDFVEHAVPLASFPTLESFKILEPLGVRYAVFHRHWYNGSNWNDAMAHLREFAPYLRLLHAEDEGLNSETRLYEIVGYPE